MSANLIAAVAMSGITIASTAIPIQAGANLMKQVQRIPKQSSRRHHRQSRKPFSFEGTITGLKSPAPIFKLKPLSIPVRTTRLGRVTISLTRSSGKRKRRR